MVRLYRLWLFRGGHRASILPRGRPDFLAARRVRRLCRGLSDAALWQSGVWPYRRQDGAQSRADGIGHADGGADIPDRTSADLPADWHYGSGAAGVAATPTGTLGGGEYTTSAIFLVERSNPGHRGFLGSFGPFGACAGVLLGSAVGAATTTILDQASLNGWGWRLPFILGISVGLSGLYIRRHLLDEAVPQRRGSAVKSPVPEALRTEWRAIVRLVGLNAGYAVGFYLCFVYITTYLRQTDHLSASKALDINTIAIAALLLLIPLAGALSDRLGRKPVMLAATGGLLVLSWPLFWMMHHPDAPVILLGQLGFAVLVAGFAAVSPAAMVELVPDRLRCTVLSVGYNLGFGILGGLTPMVAVYTINRSHDDLSPAFLLMAAAAVSSIVIAGLRETYKLALANLQDGESAVAPAGGAG